ncbi:unnamed protein product [Chondrus crispus]|uniref:Uncharacterized protein n=1 Tax=Chondrus crispus TaxID=2769 RepID=R7Q902_CHOCR|nr:unnamed protein product [Chondrus crispus]CDF33876.1 unnamed protein product [Chondrus crispus]|eukprot:XP_005713695.1 unnamed protein product [Chondrus crispus]
MCVSGVRRRSAGAHRTTQVDRSRQYGFAVRLLMHCLDIATQTYALVCEGSAMLSRWAFAAERGNWCLQMQKATSVPPTFFR